MESVEETRSNWVLSVDQPLPKPSPKEATAIKEKFMKRFQNTTVSLFQEIKTFEDQLTASD